jgi:hypothetical protein
MPSLRDAAELLVDYWQDMERPDLAQELSRKYQEIIDNEDGYIKTNLYETTSPTTQMRTYLYSDRDMQTAEVTYTAIFKGNWVPFDEKSLAWLRDHNILPHPEDKGTK